MVLRDLLSADDPLTVREKSASRSLKQWDRIAVRVVDQRDHHVISGALLPFRQEAVDFLFAGPAYLALLVNALRKHAIANGIAPEIARNAVNAMLIGTGRLVEAQGRCPSDIVGDFLAYQGMTTAALESMMDTGLDRIVSEGVEAALKKAQDL